MTQENYGYYLEGEKQPGETRILRNVHMRDGLTRDYKGMRELKSVIGANAKEYPQKQCLGTRERRLDQTYGAYKWKTYAEVDEMSQNMA